MALIQVDNLRPIGSDLLYDRESFLNDLSEEQIGLTYGGVSPTSYFIVAIGAAALGHAMGRADREDARRLK